MLRDLIFAPFQSLTRISSFVWKEITEVVRRPAVLFSLVVAPFLIMAVFGIGYSGQRRPLDTVIVVPAESEFPRDIESYRELGSSAVQIVAVTTNADAARTLLRSQRIDLLIIAPPDIRKQFLDGKQSVIGVEFNQLDPVREGYVRYIADRQVQELNRTIVQQIVTQGQQIAVRTASADLSSIPPEVVAAPTRADLKNWSLARPAVVTFFAPAVLALILQHMAVTLTALSMVREKNSGVFEVFRIAPVNVVEIVLGKYLAYTLLSLAVAVTVTALLVYGLGVPMFGPPPLIGLVLLLLTVASLGLGLLISTISDSERQAVQLSMLILLAAVFFSGFVLPLDEFIPAVRYAAYALPVTHGIRLLQDLMLRGGTEATLQIGSIAMSWQIGALAAIAVVLFVLTTFFLQRNLGRR